jgi:hypothetical protein
MTDTHALMDEDLDQAVAREVFGLSQKEIDAWPWGVPPLSSDRNLAAGLISRIWTCDRLRNAMERTLSNLPSLHPGKVELLVVSTPEEICRAAIIAARECGPLM